MANEDIAGVFNHAGPGVQKNQTVIFKRHDRDGIDDGGKPESRLQGDFPNVLEVAKVNVQRGEKKSNARRDQKHFNQINQKKQRLPPGLNTGRGQKNKENYHVQNQRNQAGNDRRENQRRPRKIYFGDDFALVDEGIHANERGLGKKVPNEHSEQKVYGVIFDRITHENAKDQVDYPKQHQRLYKRPKIAQKGILVSELELGDDQLADDAKVVGELAGFDKVWCHCVIRPP